jgi:ribosomal protein L10
MKSYINQFKLDKIKQIEKNYNNIYFFRYNDMNYNEKINLKKEIKKLKFNFLILKQNLVQYTFPNLKGQGPLMLVYGSNLLDYTSIQKFKKIEFIYLWHNNMIISNLKLKKLFLNSNPSDHYINYQLKKPLFHFINVLKQINK